MLTLEDKITVALAGPIKCGKRILAMQAEEHKDMLLQCLAGNFWVPHQFVRVQEPPPDPVLFDRFSKNPESYATPFQVWYFAQRLGQQGVVDNSSGLVFLGQPLAIDRSVYAEANREHISDAFPAYELLADEISERVTPPDVWIYCKVPLDRVDDVLIPRIERRGREGEKKFLKDPSYLRKIVELNERFFTEPKFPVITIDGTNPAFDDGENHGDYFQELFTRIVREIRTFKKPPRLTLDDWTYIDHNQAQKAAWEARRQLYRYFANNMRCVTLAGLPGTGKTGFAEMLADRLGIGIMKELAGRNEEVRDQLLAAFLWDKPTYCYPLQKKLGPERIGKRKEFYERGKSFVEDRTPDEDQAMFHRRFFEQGYLTKDQFDELRREAVERYHEAPKANLAIRLDRSPHDARIMILERGRRAEFYAWPEAELEALDKFEKRLFEEMDELGSIDGPKLSFNLAEINPDDEIHRGYIFQEMLHSLMDYDAR